MASAKSTRPYSLLRLLTSAATDDDDEEAANETSEKSLRERAKENITLKGNVGVAMTTATTNDKGDNAADDKENDDAADDAANNSSDRYGVV